MTYYGGRELAAGFRTVRNNTILLAEEIPESSYGFKAADGSRTVAQTLTHIALGHGFQSYIHQHHIDDLKQVNFQELMQQAGAEEAKVRTKAEIVALLKSEGDTFASYLEGLHEPFLAEQVAMPPGGHQTHKSRFEMLLSPKEHEMHHRAQLMVIQRMLGMTPHLTRAMQQRMAQAAQSQR